MKVGVGVGEEVGVTLADGDGLVVLWVGVGVVTGVLLVEGVGEALEAVGLLVAVGDVVAAEDWVADATLITQKIMCEIALSPPRPPGSKIPFALMSGQTAVPGLGA